MREHPDRAEGVPRRGSRPRRIASVVATACVALALPVGLLAWATGSGGASDTVLLTASQPAYVLRCDSQQPDAPVFSGTAPTAQTWVAAHPGPCWVIYYRSGTVPTGGTTTSTTTTYPSICKLYWYRHPKRCPKGP